jgi:hypothetical protein
MTEAKPMLASVTPNHIKVFKSLHPGLRDPLPWGTLAGPLAAAEDALARLDECLAKSPIREGWIARTHFADAKAEGRKKSVERTYGCRSGTPRALVDYASSPNVGISQSRRIQV